ncbi:MAG: RDD family protein [Opitutaceae bacterium]|nr:RDD family protein [Opitutaceae bacterium]
MFTIIGGDGREYGPATAEQIRSWIKAGRANLETKARADGAEEWRRLGDFAEFAPAPAVLPPPLTPAQPPAFAEAEPVRSGLVQADRGSRLMARMIDWGIDLIASIPGMVVLWPQMMELVKLVVESGQGEQPDISQLDLPRLLLGTGLLVLCALAVTVIQAWMLAVRGQSIGKRLLGLRVVKVDGSAAGLVNGWLMRELLITVIGIAASLVPFFGIMLRPAFHLVDWCMIFRDDERCLHDQIAGTRVVKV